MDLGSIFILLAAVVLVALFVSRPFFERETAPASKNATTPSETEHQRSFLLAERDRILDALQELDFDNTLGKIPEEEYPFQRRALMQRGAEVLKKLDALQADNHLLAAEDRLEDAIAERRMDGKRPAGRPASSAGPDDELEELIASRRRQREENASGFCPRCGKPVQKSDHFCPKCGATL